jgi:phage baseplate assembly protein W
MADYPEGLSFPFRISPAGGFARVTGGKKINANLTALVKTAIKERLIRKQVGTVGYNAVFRTASTSGLIPALIKQAFSAWEPRAVNVSVTIFEKDVQGKHHVFAQVGYLFKLSGEPETVTVQLSE